MGYRYSFWHRVGALQDVRERADEIVERIGMAKRRDRAAGVLTYAEQRALEIGVTIAGGADVILLDEPTAGMSRSETDDAVELIRNVTEGKTLIMVEHDMSVVFDLADRISVLVYGEVHRQRGTPEEIRGNSKAVQEAYLGRNGLIAVSGSMLRCLKSRTCTLTTARATSCTGCTCTWAGRDREPAGAQRRGPLHHHQVDHGPGRIRPARSNSRARKSAA